MALFDMMAIGSDKQAVILDIGEAYTKVGFAGEPIPRHIIKSEVQRLKEDKLETVKVVNHNANEEELYSILRDFLHNIYFKFLLVNPKERRVVVCESILCPVGFRNVLAKVLFKHFEVVSLLLAPGHLLALFTLGVPSALVVDCGYRETLVVPIFESTPILSAVTDIPLGAHELHRTIMADVIDKGTVIDSDGHKTAASALSSLKEDTLEDLKVRLCFVGRYDAPHSLLPQSVLYPLFENKSVDIPGSLRCNAYNMFFNGNEEGKSVASIILDSIVRCPIDCRKVLAKNILLVGGTVMAPGFASRLICELNSLLVSEAYCDKLAFRTVKLRIPPVPANYVSWLGGAIYGALEILGDISVSRDKYKQDPCLPDWASIIQYKINDQEKGILDKSPKWQTFKKSVSVTPKTSK